VRFALVSAIITVLIALAAGLTGAGMIANRETHAAARTADAFVGATVAAIAGEIEDQDLDTALAPLVAGDVRAIRVFDSSGDRIAAVGDSIAESGPLTNPSDDLGWLQTFASSGDELLASTRTRDGITVEVFTEPDGVADAIGASRRDLAFSLVAFSIAFWLLLQGGFRLAISTLTDEHGRLVYLYDTGQQLRSSLDLHDVMTRLASDAASVGNGDYGLVVLYDAPTTEVVLRATYDRTSDRASLLKKPIDEWYARRAIATKTTIISSQGAASYRPHLGVDAEVDPNAYMLCAPMCLGERVVGALVVIRCDPALGKGFSAAEVHLVQELAAQAVTAVEQAQLFSKVRADADELEMSYDSTLKALMAALDAKDNVTEGHCERVARITVHLARAMEIPDDMLVHIERGALLHDVGKIGVPDGILKKPKALNEGEWEAMRKHPLLAGLMVSKIGFLEPALPILLYHHERFDGRGYPFGLVGDNIPLEARIFSVIDAYDAMTSDRPYRAAMPYEAAMAEIRANSGRQFDPVVVDAFEALLNRRPELRDQAGPREISDHDRDLLGGLGESAA
jgi:hypothetical protein